LKITFREKRVESFIFNLHYENIKNFKLTEASTPRPQSKPSAEVDASKKISLILFPTYSLLSCAG